MRAEFQARADEEDRSDPLSEFRERFYIPTGADGSEVVYLLGNSLGLQPKSVASFVARELEKWKRHGVAGHFEGDDPWLPYQDVFRAPIAELVGGTPREVVLMNGLTVNLHLMMATFFRPSRLKSKIVIEAAAFPSDRYAVESQLLLHGLAPEEHLIQLSPRSGEDVLRSEDIIDTLSKRADQIALVLLGGVNYYSGHVLDMEAISQAAGRLHLPIGFDLAHAVGNVPLRLHDWGCDFAVWCTYKYLNSGPGGIAGCFVNERHARDRATPRLAGWWGNDPATRFLMLPDFQPSDSADGWQLSNPPILQLAALRASLEIFQEAGVDRMRVKSLLLTSFTREILGEIEGPFRIITPEDPGRFGCQLSLHFSRNGHEVFQALERSGIVCDYRDPDVIRIAPVPLYNSFADVWRFGSALEAACR